MLLAELKLDEVSVATGLLHDVLEDTEDDEGGARRALRPGGRRRRRRRHEDRPVRLHVEGGAAGRDVPEDAPRDDGRPPGHPRQAGRPPPQHADARATSARRSGARSRPRRWRSTRRSRTGSGWARIKGELEDLSFQHLHPDEFAALSGAVDERMKASGGRHREAPERHLREAGGGGHPGRGERPREAALVDPPEAHPPVDPARPALRRPRVPRPRRLGPRLLQRPRHRPPGLAAGPRPDQGLHRDAEAELLPVAPHDGDPGGRAPVRDPDPDARDGPRRRAGDRGALEVQGRAREPPRRRAGDRGDPADPRDDPGHREPPRVPLVAQDGPLRRRGLHLHAEGRGLLLPARGDAGRLRLPDPHRRRPPLRRARG